MKPSFYGIVTAITLVLGTSLLHHQTQAQAWRGRLAAQNGEMAAQVKGLLEDKVASMTGGWVSLGADRRLRAEEYQREASTAETASHRHAWALAVAMTVLTLLSLSKPPVERAAHVALVAFGSWVLGILLPVMSLKVHAPVEGLGNLVLRDETKSLVSLLGNLLQVGNWLMLALVGGFGVVAPLLKSLCQMLSAQHPEARRLGGWLARWSLVDVIVVALAVFVLGSKGEIETEVQTGLGFWFFLAATLLSLSAGWMKAAPSAGKEKRTAATHPMGVGIRW